MHAWPALVARERRHWEELERRLTELESQPPGALPLEDALRLYELERRARGALGRARALPRDAELRLYLEALVARAFLELRPRRRRSLSPWARARRLLTHGLPSAFRQHLPAFWLALAITVLGMAFGAAAVALEPRAKEYVLPFTELLVDPRDRVLREEATRPDHSQAATFAAMLMANNISVSFRAFALGALLGLGTVAIVFYNGVVLGAVAYDYAHAGQTEFLLGWLLPHGSIEIPAVLISAQAGFVLGQTVLGRGQSSAFAARLRAIAPDLATLLCGTALLLAWASLVESFFSQYHWPVLPYTAKITFGVCELALLTAYLFWPRPAEPES